MRNSHAFYILAVLVLIPTMAFAQSQADDILGKWDAGEAKVMVHHKDGTYIGHPINPATGKEETKIKLLDLVYKGGKYTGKIYVRKKKKFFDVTAEVKGDKLNLTVSAGFMTKNVEWARVK